MLRSLSPILCAVLAVAVPAAAATDSASPTNAPAVEVEFPGTKAARQAIVDDSLDPYFDRLQTMEMSAKTGSPIKGKDLSSQRNECRRRYRAAVRAFTGEEKEALRWHVTKVKRILDKDYPLLGTIPWSFIKTVDSIEGGLPHTRGKHIVLTEKIAAAAVTSQANAFRQPRFIRVIELLLHEQVHVFQRTHPGCFDSLYTQVWRMEKAPTITACQWITEHRVLNPDAIDCRWVFPVKSDGKTTHLWPLVVFTEGEGLKRMPRDFRMVAVNVTKEGNAFRVDMGKDGKPVARDLLSVKEYSTAFPLSGAIYHPAEAAADLFGKIVVCDTYLPRANPESDEGKVQAVIEKGFAPLRKWFRKHFKLKKKRDKSND